jgi:type IV pilus assembly protein PilE
MIAKKTQGFTLIELMIVVAIVGILASVSMAFYGNYVTKAKRTDGRSTLTETAARLEKCKAIYGGYDNGNCDSVIPTESSEGYYGITDVRTASAFTLTATPVTGKSQANDSDCTVMTLDNTGIKGGSNPDECW